MLRKVITTGVAVLATAAVVILVNIALFSFFPLLHRFFSDAIAAQVVPHKKHEVIMEYRKPEKKEEVHKERLIEQSVSKRQGRSPSKMQLRFTPDLSVEGTGTVGMEEQELTAALFEEGETDEPLIPLYRPNLTFSNRAVELEIEGTLEVILIVDTQGKVASIDVVRTPHPIITAEARKVISTWRFKPAKNKGIPVRVRMIQVVEFKLD